MSIEAMKQALDELEYVLECINQNRLPFDGDDYHETMRLLRQAIEQAENQKPVAYLDAVFTETVWVPPARKFWLKEHEDKAWCAFHAKHMDDIPLYTAPPQREWLELTDEKIHALADECLYDNLGKKTRVLDFARAIEGTLKEKNAHGWQSVDNPTEWLDDLRGGADE